MKGTTKKQEEEEKKAHTPSRDVVRFRNLVGDELPEMHPKAIQHIDAFVFTAGWVDTGPKKYTHTENSTPFPVKSKQTDGIVAGFNNSNGLCFLQIFVLKMILIRTILRSVNLF